MKKSLKTSLPIIDRLIEKLDVYGDSPVIFFKDDIAPKFMPQMHALMKHNLVSKCLTNQVSCINCDAQANVKREGNNGESLFALCKVCGCNFRVSEGDIYELRVTWLGFAGWLSAIIGLTDEPEIISTNTYFLGSHQNGAVNYEIHLMKRCAADDAKQGYQAIAQQKTNPVIVLSLSNRPLPSILRDMRIIPLSECLIHENSSYIIHFPEWAFSDADPVKQRAGYAKVANDPQHQCKELLKEFVCKNITSLFARMMHPDIRKMVEEKYSQYLQYKDKHGKQKTLSGQIILDVIREVLEDTGQTDYISGRKQPY